MEITFQLVRGLHWSSKIIGWFGSGYYSHIDVVTPHNYLRGARSDWIKGIPPGCRDRPQHYETWAAATRFTIDVTADQYKQYWAFSDDQLGKPYDKRGLVADFLLGRQWRDTDSWWCSEWAAANLEHAGIIEIPPHVTSVEPGDCAFIFAGLQSRREEMAL